MWIKYSIVETPTILACQISVRQISYEVHMYRNNNVEKLTEQMQFFLAWIPSIQAVIWKKCKLSVTLALEKNSYV